MSKSKGKSNKVLISGRIDPGLFEALDRLCKDRNETRSDVLARALQSFIVPAYHEEREAVVTANLDKVLWRLIRHDDQTQRDLRIVQEMVGRLARDYYDRTPRVPEPARKEHEAAGRAQYEAFLEAVAERVGPGKTLLEQAPKEVRVREEDLPAFDSPGEGAGDRQQP